LKHRKQIAAVVAAAIIAAGGGCARPPRPGIPIDPDRLEDLVERVEAGTAAGPLRASGRGTIAEAGDSLGFSFALLYDPPGWLRADARPTLVAAPGPPGVSALVVGDHLTARLSGTDSWLTTDLRDVLPGIEWTDPGSFLVGRPDVRLLTRLRHARIERTAAGLVVSGDLFGRTIEAVIDTTVLSVTRVSVNHGDAFSVTMSYSGHGWHRYAAMPRRVVATYAKGAGDPITITITYDRAACEGHVDRRETWIEAPPGAPVLRWDDLGIRRKP